MDTVSLLEMNLGEISDREVRQIAHAEQRVVVTLDRDLLEPFGSSDCNPNIPAYIAQKQACEPS